MDGYVAGPGQGREDPLGERGERLHDRFVRTRTFKTVFGESGGETGLDDDRVAAWSAGEKFGATIMGRNMFGPIRGAWGDGPESALEQARDAAGSRDISIAGGAATAQQYLRLGLIDEMEIHVVPALLGAGERLFDNLDGPPAHLEPVEVASSPRVAHFRYARAIHYGTVRGKPK